VAGGGVSSYLLPARKSGRADRGPVTALPRVGPPLANHGDVVVGLRDTHALDTGHGACPSGAAVSTVVVPSIVVVVLMRSTAGTSVMSRSTLCSFHGSIRQTPSL